MYVCIYIYIYIYKFLQSEKIHLGFTKPYPEDSDQRRVGQQYISFIKRLLERIMLAYKK